MRRILVSCAFFSAVTGACAADLPVLRGPIAAEVVPVVPLCPWAGIYGGIHGGFSTANIDFTSGVNALVADEVRLLTIEQDQNISSWPVLPKKNPVGGSFGAFIGYNWQWEDAVTGFEINYNRTSLSASSGSSIARSFFDNKGIPAPHNYLYDITVTGAASARITDWATFRARGAWAAGPFLPYGFVAFAVGRTDLARSASVSGTGVDQITPVIDPTTNTCTANCVPLPDIPISESRSDARTGVFAYGAAAGLGIDIALSSNLFARAEWEYVLFAPVEHVRIKIDTIRAGLGLKF